MSITQQQPTPPAARPSGAFSTIGRRLLAFSLFLLLGQLPLSAQPGMGEEYEVGDVTVEGAEFSDENSIIAVSGLRVGDKVRIPGYELQRAMTSLWELQLFEDVKILKKKVVGDVVMLAIVVKERPRLVRYDFVDVKKGHVDDLKGKVTPFLLKGGIVTEASKRNVANAMEAYYEEKGFLDAKAIVKEVPDENLENGIKLQLSVDRGAKVKIQDIRFTGVTAVKERKLRKLMKETKRKAKWFSGSKFLKNEYENDKRAIIDYYNTIGYRDARITGDSLWRVGEKRHLMIRIDIEEGREYRFRDIAFKGNSIYDDEKLAEVLGINSGDVYNEELLNTRLQFAQDGRDISSLYMDKGYLFFNVQAIEKAVYKDSIDMEIRIFEGPQATIDKILIAGNDRTHEHVIRRELRTLPGRKFSRADIIRSQRELMNLGYFNPETLGVNPVPNLQRGTVDIEYNVEEQSSDQLELSAGWGGRGRGVIGTLGVTFNNFSLQNIFKKEAWRPLPQGDGQRLSIRAQTNGRFFQSYNFSFTEPWLGGKKPNSFTLSGFYSLVTNGADRDSDNYASLGILGLTAGLGTRLRVPDDFFVSNTSLSFQSYKLRDYGAGGFVLQDGTVVTNGRFNNFAIKQTFARNSISNPLFPTSGSRVSLSVSFTPPYSLFRDVENFDELSGEGEVQAWAEDNLRFLEYHKWRFDVEWYAKVVGKLTLKVGGKFGFLGTYNDALGVTPFERYELGGDGLANQFVGIAGRDILSMRGYEVEDIAANDQGGATVFNKLSVELRYPVSLNPSSTIYVLGFFDGGNAWSNARDYNPLDLRRATGLGVRIFLPMFGLLGFDYGIGFDKADTVPNGSPWTDYANFNLILGFEPE